MILRTILIKLFVLYYIAAQGQGTVITCDDVNPDVVYRARYVQYESGNYYRNSLSDKPNNFYNNQSEFYIPVTLHQNLTTTLNTLYPRFSFFENDVEDAINDWNGISPVLKFSKALNKFSSPIFLIDENYPNFQEPINVIGFEDDEQLLILEHFNRGFYFTSPDLSDPVQENSTFELAITILYYRPLNPNESDCDYSELWYSPSISGFDILINPNYRYFHGDIYFPAFFEDVYDDPSEIHPTSKSLWTSFRRTISHELGHAAGLGHFGEKHNLMYPTQPDREFQAIDFQGSAYAINRLYWCDGTSNTFDDKYDSFGCAANSPFFRYKMIDGLGLHVDFSRYNLGGGANGTSNPDAPNCNNCIEDGREHSIDCGGPDCVPCNTKCTGNQYQERIQNNDFFTRRYTVVKDDIKIGKNVTSNLPTGTVNLPSYQSYYFQAGDYIDIQPGFVMGEGIKADFIIDDCNCAEICEPFLPDVITPNCDDINDFLHITVDGATHFDVVILNLWENKVYEKSGTIKNRNILLWNGLTNNGSSVADGTYYYIVTLSNSCNSSQKVFSSHITVFESSNCMENEVFIPHSRINQDNTDELGTIDDIVYDLYPNPSNGAFEINCNRDLKGGDVNIYSAEGKLVHHYILESSYEKFNLNLSSGIYFMKIDANGYKTTKKLIIN